jgi:pumilio family protein 6
LKGHASKLAVHAIGARVIELLFSTFPQKITSPLKLEFYGPRFSLFNHSGVQSDSTSTSVTLTTIIKHDPNTKEAALQSILAIINKGVEKSLFSFAYFQKILCEYVVCASPNEVQSLCPSLVDHAIHLLSTKHGSRVVAECAAYGTSKDRKKIMKSLKGYTRSSMLHHDAYIAILRILDVIDDTVSAQKSILAELKLPIVETKMKDISSDEVEKEDKKSTLLDLALSDTGSKLFLFLLANNQDIRKKYFDPSELEILRPNPMIQDGSSEIPTSKKDPKTRRVELLQFLRKDLLELCQSHTSELLRSRCGSKVILEVFKTFPVVDLVSSIIDATQDSLKDDRLSLFEDPIGHRSIEKMLMSQSNCKSATEEESIVLISTALSSTFKGKLLQSIGRSNRGAFVLSALAKSNQIGNVGKELKNAEKDIKRISEKMKDDGKPIAGYQLLMSVLD